MTTDSPHSERRVSLTACVVMAVTSLAAAGSVYLVAIAGAGFPDGHLTDYQRWALPWQQAGVLGLGALGAGFLGLPVIESPLAARLFRAAIVAVIVVLVAAIVVVPRVGRDVLQLEDGQGG